MSTLNVAIQDLIDQNRLIQQDAEALAGGLSDAQFNWAAEPGRWSIAQCLDHLNITNTKELALIDAAIARGRAEVKRGEGPYHYGLLSRLFRRSLEPPVRLKWMKAPRPFQPAPQKSVAEVTAEFRAVHERLIASLERSNGLDLVSVKVPSAFSDRVHYALGMAFWILAAHDRRHLWQARQVRRSPGFPS